jgi:hypothetical protein
VEAAAIRVEAAEKILSSGDTLHLNATHVDTSGNPLRDRGPWSGLARKPPWPQSTPRVS